MSTKAMPDMGDSVIVFASFRAVAEKGDELGELLAWMVENTRREPGCERYDLYRQRGADGAFHLFERYRSNEALDEHRAADYYVEYRRRVAHLIEGTVDVILLDAIDVAG